jgi:hypothetical protein
LLDHLFLWLVAGMYCFYPSVQEAVSWDLRPYIFIVPFFWLSFLALQGKRPSYEVLPFFILLLATREEALFFAAIIACYALAGRHQTDDYYRHLAPRLIATLLLACVFYTLYFAWIMPSYTSTVFGVLLRMVMWFGFIGGSMLATAGLHSILVRRGTAPRHLELFQAATLLLVFVPLGFQFYSFNNGMPFYEMVEIILGYPRQSLHVACSLLVLFVGWQLLRRPLHKRVALALSALAFLWLTTQNFRQNFGPASGPYQSYLQYKSEQPEVALVFAMRERFDKYHTVVLSDFRTYQAFYDFENVFILNAVPAYLAAGKTKAAQDSLFNQLLQQQVEYIVIRTSSRTALMKALNAAKMEPRVHLIQSNKRFLVYKVRRPG